MAVDIKNKIEGIQKAKNSKREEMKKRYEELTENEENLDMLMMQLGKEIERIFPNLRFVLLGRIKSPQSFEDKLENALNKCQDAKSVKEIQIYDIIGLNVIVEDVPNDLILDNFKKSESYDKDFESNISDYILRKKVVALDIIKCQKSYEKCKEQLEKIDKNKKRKQERLAKLQNRGKHTEIDEIKNQIMEEIEEIKEDIQNSNEQIEYLKNAIKIQKEILEHGKILNEAQKNECNNEMAKFIIRKLTQFEGVKLLELKSIKNRFKIIEKDNGYRSTHNCYAMKIKEKDKTVNYECEVQGKSIEAYYESSRGRAAKYHIQPDPKPGKKLKNKNLPDILSVKTPEDKKNFLEKVSRTVPKFRIYRNNGGKSEIYKLSLRERYMFYYYNQLFGNEIFGISKNNKQISAVTETDILDGKGQIYNSNLEYQEL